MLLFSEISDDACNIEFIFRRNIFTTISLAFQIHNRKTLNTYKAFCFLYLQQKFKGIMNYIFLH